MSYYEDKCLNSFSNEQSDLMIALLTGNPSWSFLIDTQIPTCQDFPLK